MKNQNIAVREIDVVSRSTFMGKEIDVYGTAYEPLFKAKDVAEWIGHSDVSMMMRSVDDDEKVTSIVCTPGGNQNAWFLTENGLYEVLMQSRKPIAKQFKKGVKEILKTIRRTGKFKAQPQQSFLQEKLIVADWMMKTLRYSDVAKLQLVSSIVQPYGLPVPEYVTAPNGAKHSASELLKTHNIEMSAIKFNKLAMAAGLLELKERKGHSKIHKFYSITDKGSAYGENDVNMNNPNQTQPHWYDGKFSEVLELIKANLESQVNLFA